MTKVAQHTPGPWVAIGSKIYSETAFEDYTHEDGSPVRICVVDLYGSMGGNSHQDTQLITAAPDLLKALEAFVDGDNADSIDTRYENARQAIVKATGATS